MGGFGSGRTTARPVAEDALKLDLARLMAEGVLRANQRTRGQFRWTSDLGRGRELELCFEADLTDPTDSWLRLGSDPWTSGSAKQFEVVRVVTTSPNYGGWRYWFVCPIVGRRARVLYRPIGTSVFASRVGWGLPYRSQRQTRTDRLIDKSQAIRRRVGSDAKNLLELPVLFKPKGMHETTYRRLVTQMEDLCQALWRTAPF